MPHVSALFIYPLKSARGTAVATLELDERGAMNDRRWMVVNDDGRAVTQREEPLLSLVSPGLALSGLQLSAPGMPTLAVEQPGADAQTIRGEVWDGHCPVRLADEAVHEWISAYLGHRYRVVFQPDDAVLPMLPKYAGAAGDMLGDRRVALTDGAPILLAGQASLDDLNGRLAKPLPMNRFRPNIVVDGAGPYEEDAWSRIQAGSVVFEMANQCPRCVTTTVDQATGVPSHEPLRTLATYRKVGSGVMFGRNVTHHAPGRVSVGDQIEVLA